MDAILLTRSDVQAVTPGVGKGSMLRPLYKLIARAASKRMQARPLIMVLSNQGAHDACLSDTVKHLACEYDILLVDIGRPTRLELSQDTQAWVVRMPLRILATDLLCRIAVWMLASLSAPRFIVLFPNVHGKLSIMLEWGGHTTIRCLSNTDVSGVDEAVLIASMWTTSGLVFLDDQSVRMTDERCFALAARDYVVSDPSLNPCDTAAVGTRTSYTECLANAISSIGNKSVELRASEQPSREIIKRSDTFDGLFACGAAGIKKGRRKQLQLYLQTSRLATPRKRAHTGRMIKRPAIGFNPLIYANDAPNYEETNLDPLADFIRKGRPLGRWTHDVITTKKRASRCSSTLRVAIHGHFYYEELFPEFLERLGRNASDVDLYITTSSSRQADAILATAKPRNVKLLDVQVVPNRGRDIGALLSGYDCRQWDEYDILGHVHGKRCSYRERAFGDEWRTFMWGALIGGDGAVMDAVLDSLASDRTLGLVFPEDPFLHGMDGNQERTDCFADRFGLKTPLPAHFEFPMGSMYFSRPQALADLWALGLSWEDYPMEPLPNDGTMLHALERLPTFIVEKNGYRFATVYVEGSYRG